MPSTGRPNPLPIRERKFSLDKEKEKRV